MKAIRVLVALVILGCAAVAVHRHFWREYTCDIEKKNADRRLYRAFRDKNDSDRDAIGRATLARLKPCLDRDSSDYQLRVSYGMAAQAAGQKDLAMEMYRSALALNERPEILANIAELQFEMGQPNEARQNLLRACYFHIAYVRKVGEPMRRELFEAVQARRKQLLAAKNRPD
jgi:Tfp pilus assembly protein PilF